MPYSMKRCYLITTLAAGLSVGVYLIWAAANTAPGFPLDDGWIHQVFARNLAQRGEFSYNPGQIVAGSTSPLWTFMLVPGYLFGGESYKWWAYLLGLLFLVLTAGEVARLYRLLFPLNQPEGKWPAYLIAALFTLFEWHLVWAGASGMETLLFTFGTLLLVRYYLETAQKETTSEKVLIPYGLLGLVGGLLTLVRPEGMVLLGLVGLDIGWRKFSKANRRNWLWLGQRWLAIALVWLVPLVPYLIFNYSASGSPLPTTFYAKASGYANDHSLGAMLDYLGKALVEIIGRSPLLFLLPGLVFALYLCLKPGQRLGDWRPLVWPPLLLVLYAIQLPVTYQHGRYLMPLIPFLALYGVFGTAKLIEWLQQQKLQMVARLVPFVLALPVLIAWLNNAQAYQFDVKLINDEQVRIGLWLRDNTPPSASVASHDIGAIGYFSQRHLVDTAGLVSPEFIPIVGNEPAILERLRTEGVTYLALFPDWYAYLNQLLTDEGRKVFQPAETYLAPLGKENMAVFKLK